MNQDKAMDPRFTQLVAESKSVVTVVGSPTLTVFEFLELGTNEMDETNDFLARGWIWVGLIGVDEHGEPQVRLAIPFDYSVMERVCRDFVARVKQEWYGASELERLFKLNDPRLEN